MAYEYVMKTLEREKKRCRKMYKKNRGNHGDTGHKHFYNAMELWANREVEIDRFMSVFFEEKKVREYEFAQMLKMIEELVDEFCGTYFYNDALKMLQNRLKNLLVRWH